MPTHKGTSQTDITIGSGGTTMTTVVSFDLLLAEGETSVEGPRLELRSGSDAWSIELADTTGGSMATIGVAWTSAVLGAHSVSTTTRAHASPEASSGAPAWPGLPTAGASRDWEQTLTQRGRPWAIGHLSFELAAEAGPGTELGLTLVDALDHELGLHVEVSTGGRVVLSGTVQLTVRFWPIERGLVAASPLIDDELT